MNLDQRDLKYCIDYILLENKNGNPKLRPYDHPKVLYGYICRARDKDILFSKNTLRKPTTSTKNRMQKP